MPRCDECGHHYTPAETGDPLGAPLDGDDWVCFACHPDLSPPDLPDRYQLPATAYRRTVERAYAEGDHEPGAGVPARTVAERLGVSYRTTAEHLSNLAATGQLETTPSLGLGSAQTGRTTFLPPDEA